MPARRLPKPAVAIPTGITRSRRFGTPLVAGTSRALWDASFDRCDEHPKNLVTVGATARVPSQFPRVNRAVPRRVGRRSVRPPVRYRALGGRILTVATRLALGIDDVRRPITATLRQPGACLLLKQGRRSQSRKCGAVARLPVTPMSTEPRGAVPQGGGAEVPPQGRGGATSTRSSRHGRRGVHPRGPG